MPRGPNRRCGLLIGGLVACLLSLALMGASARVAPPDEPPTWSTLGGSTTPVSEGNQTASLSRSRSVLRSVGPHPRAKPMPDDVLQDAQDLHRVTSPATRWHRPGCSASRVGATSIPRPLTGEGHPVAVPAPATSECGAKPVPAFMVAAPEGSDQPVDLRRDLAEMATLQLRN